MALQTAVSFVVALVSAPFDIDEVLSKPSALSICRGACIWALLYVLLDRGGASFLCRLLGGGNSYKRLERKAQVAAQYSLSAVPHGPFQVEWNSRVLSTVNAVILFSGSAVDFFLAWLIRAALLCV